MMRVIVPLIVALALAAADVATAQASADGCNGLAGMQIPVAAIALPTRGAVVDKATLVDKDRAGVVAPYCAVLGRIASIDPQAPAIEFQVNLPEKWNEFTAKNAAYFGR